MNKHSELELKWAADHISPDEFLKGMNIAFLGAPDCKVYLGTDWYLRNADRVLRYRFDHEGGVQELTTKQRKSADCIRDRVEINVKLDMSEKPEDVLALAEALGFTLEVALVKKSWVIHVALAGRTAGATIAYYQVEKTDQSVPMRTFIEVEIDFAPVEQSEAERTLDTYKTFFMKRYGLAAPLNESLYEMYTGNTYKIAKGT